MACRGSPGCLKLGCLRWGWRTERPTKAFWIMPVSGETNKYNERNQGDDFKLPPCTVPLQSVLEQRLGWHLRAKCMFYPQQFASKWENGAHTLRPSQQRVVYIFPPKHGFVTEPFCCLWATGLMDVLEIRAQDSRACWWIRDLHTNMSQRMLLFMISFKSAPPSQMFIYATDTSSIENKDDSSFTSFYREKRDRSW